jgi:hypothetical protein
VEAVNPHPTRAERAFERFCEDDLTEACWDQFLSNEGDPFAVLGNLVIEALRWTRTDGAFSNPPLDRASEKAVLAMEALARSVNAAVRRGDCDVIGGLDSWTELDLWWANAPLLPKPIRNAVRAARPLLLQTIRLMPRTAVPTGLRWRMDDAVLRAYGELATGLWWEGHPGPRTHYAYGYTD